MPASVIVIGAGVGGLYVAREVERRTGKVPVVVESASRVGGRINSVYDESGRLLYEAGPWRIPKSHRRMLHLIESLGIRVHDSGVEHPSDSSSIDVVPGLSRWDVNVLKRRDALSADHSDLATGYSGEDHCASGTAPYATDAGGFVVVDRGFQHVAERMAESCNVLLNTRVVDVRRSNTDYIVQCRCREADGTFVNRIYRSTIVFICVPPSAAERWSIVSQWARAQVYAVSAEPLHHIYALRPEEEAFAMPFHHRLATAPIAQTISSMYPSTSAFFQASYTGGRLARFWHRLRMSSPRMFLAVLRQELWNILSVDPGDDDVRSHYVDKAYHIWKPTPSFCLHKAVAVSIMPNARHLPNVYWVGEAFSSYQGWMEGALETADLALSIFGGKASYVLPKRVLGEDEVLLEGRVLDVSGFRSIHPGGTHAIQNHLRENVTDLFYHMSHSADAWAVVFGLQVACEA